MEIGLCAVHLAEAERIERRLAAAERQEARRAAADEKAAASAAERGRKATPTKVPAGAAKGSRKAQGAVAGHRPHSQPFREFEGQCTGLNSKGRRCRKPAEEGSDRCEHHPR